MATTAASGWTASSLAPSYQVLQGILGPAAITPNPVTPGAPSVPKVIVDATNKTGGPGGNDVPGGDGTPGGNGTQKTPWSVKGARQFYESLPEIEQKKILHKIGAKKLDELLYAPTEVEGRSNYNSMTPEKQSALRRQLGPGLFYNLTGAGDEPAVSPTASQNQEFFGSLSKQTQNKLKTQVNPKVLAYLQGGGSYSNLLPAQQKLISNILGPEYVHNYMSLTSGPTNTVAAAAQPQVQAITQTSPAPAQLPVPPPVNPAPAPAPAVQPQMPPAPPAPTAPAPTVPTGNLTQGGFGAGYVPPGGNRSGWVPNGTQFVGNQMLGSTGRVAGRRAMPIM